MGLAAMPMAKVAIPLVRDLFDAALRQYWLKLTLVMARC
jgi:hypothetical protein